MAYIEKLPENKDGLQELWETTQPFSDERFVAGIQCKNPDRKKIIKKTADLRKSRNILEPELIRLAEFAQTFNKKWATKNNKAFDSASIMLKKIHSTHKRWREVLKMCTPRFNQNAYRKDNIPSIYRASILTFRSYVPDAFGLQSYDYYVDELYDEVTRLLIDLVQGLRLCFSVMRDEEAISQNKEWIKEIFNDCYDLTVESSRDTIEKMLQLEIIDTNNPVYQKMLQYDNRDEFIREQFHKFSESQFNDFVIIDVVMKLKKNNITKEELQLWGEDYETIKRVRYALAHLHKLSKMDKNNTFRSKSLLEFIVWCRPKIDRFNIEEGKRKIDIDHLIYDYLNKTKPTGFVFVKWNSVFTERLKCIGRKENFQLKADSFEIRFGSLYKAQEKKEKAFFEAS